MSGMKGKQWVLLAAGSKGWINYRHQANVCHAYQMVHSHDIPDEQVVVMMYDDIAYNEKNPFPGEIINEPIGPNVYPGVLKDYTGDDVSVGNFLAVLRGDEAGVNKKSAGPKKVLKSEEQDTVFVYLSDHGNKGVFGFPREFLHASDLIKTINDMTERPQFSKMVIYMESCCSASMIDHLPKNTRVYGVSASTACQSHSACFYDEDRLTFLAGEFTTCWLLHSEMSDLTQTSFEDQFVYLRQKVTQSTPCQYGNNELSKVFISDVLGSSDPKTRASYTCRGEILTPTHLTPSCQVSLLIYQLRIQRETDPDQLTTLQQYYDKLLQVRAGIEKVIQDISILCCCDVNSTSDKDGGSHVQLEDIKDVAEHFRHTFTDCFQQQDEDDESFVVSQMCVLVKILEAGVDVCRIKEAITDVHDSQNSQS